MKTRQLNKGFVVCLFLIILLVITLFVSIISGAVELKFSEMISSIGNVIDDSKVMTLNERIFFDIRLPRALLCILVGAAISVSGVLMQGLFRNPIIEPGLIGTSSGAAFGAALYFVLGSKWHFETGEWVLPLAAAAGATVSTLIVFALSHSSQKPSTPVNLLLTGIAINALFLSGIGFLSYIARDPQARSITFWNLGTMSGAGWHAVQVVALVCTLCMPLSIRQGKNLNALMLGEEEAQYAGLDPGRVKINIVILHVLLVATATAFVGVISFIGLIVPHLLRMLHGAGNRYLIINSALAGGIFVSVADILARLLVKPAELPIGIITSLVGVPVFIYLLRKGNYNF